MEEDLPQLVQLQKKHGDAVAAMTFNVNYSGEEEDKEEIIAKLKEIGVGPAIENILSTEPADDVYAKLDLGAVPAVYVFDKSGQLAERFDYNDPEKFGEDGFSYEKHVGPLVDKLVNQ